MVIELYDMKTSASCQFLEKNSLSSFWERIGITSSFNCNIFKLFYYFIRVKNLSRRALFSFSKNLAQLWKLNTKKPSLYKKKLLRKLNFISVFCFTSVSIIYLKYYIKLVFTAPIGNQSHQYWGQYCSILVKFITLQLLLLFSLTVCVSIKYRSVMASINYEYTFTPWFFFVTRLLFPYGWMA